MNTIKATILLVMLPERSTFNATFMLARRLAEAEFRVVYIGPPGDATHVRLQGFEYAALASDRVPPANSREPELSKVGRWWDRLRESRRDCLQHLNNLHHDLNAFDSWLQINPVNLVLLDPLMGVMAEPLLRRRIPIVGLCNTLTARLDTRFPPVFSAIVPDAGPTAAFRLRYVLAWVKLLVWLKRQEVCEDAQLLLTVGPYRFRENRFVSLVRKAGGKLRYGEYGPRLDVPELILAPREIDFPAVAAQRGRFYVGSAVDIHRKETDDFDWGAVETGRPLLYCSLGTYGSSNPHAKRVFTCLIEALRNDSRWQAIVQVGDAVDASDFGQLPRHILVTRFAPQVQVLERASLFITHGGFSSVREAVFLGVPMIVLPCWLDQPGNAARVVYHRLGVIGDAASLSPRKLLELIAAAQNLDLRHSIRDMQAAFRKHESCQEGFNWIRSFLALQR